MPIALALFGVGMTLGTMVGGRLADWSVLRTLVIAPVATLVVQLVFTVTAHAVVPAAVTLLVLAFTASLSLPAITARLLDVSGDGKALASTLNHSALNVANAIGAWLGGVVIAAGFGYTAPAVVGAALSAAGLLVLAVSIGLERRDRRRVGRAGRAAAGSLTPYPPRPSTETYDELSGRIGTRNVSLGSGRHG